MKQVKSHDIFVLLLRLRQVCCHCGLIAATLEDDNASDVDADFGSVDLLDELRKLNLEGAAERRTVSTIFHSKLTFDDAAGRRTPSTYSLPLC